MKRCLAILPIALLSLMAMAADQTNPSSSDNRGSNNTGANNNTSQSTQLNRDQNNQFNRDQNNNQFNRDQSFNRDQNQTNRDGFSDNHDQNGNQQPKQAELSYRQRVVTGKVLDTKEADVTAEGKTEKHFLAKVQTYDNFPVVVDFGPKASMKTELKKDDEIAAFGIAGRMNRKPLVFASKVALITPIEGREEIFESVPVGFNQGQGGNQQMQGQASSERMGQQMFQNQGNFQGQSPNNWQGGPGNFQGQRNWQGQPGNFNGDPRMMNNPNFQRGGSDCESR